MVLIIVNLIEIEVILMGMTVITISSAPVSLRGDLTKWMQEIATGVYVGDLNSRVREALWERVIQSVGRGQATLSYPAKNELGYQFKTYGTLQKNVSFDGIPLVMIPRVEKSAIYQPKRGFSKQAKFSQARKYASKRGKSISYAPYVVIDIETTGLDPLQDGIIEIAALRVEEGKISEFHSLILHDKKLPDEVTKLTGITNELLAQEGLELPKVLEELVHFIGSLPIVGYNLHFDIDFLNHNLRNMNKEIIKNKKVDLLGLVKKEKMFLSSYKLQDVLVAYGLEESVSHRALEDAKLTNILATKVNEFAKVQKPKP